MSLSSISRSLSDAVGKMRFAEPVTHVYNPLEYARAPHEAYLERWGSGTREVLMLGMNPGPFGMAQTGVPFGEIALVRDWLGIEGQVGKPPNEHPKRPIEGFACKRSEVSGRRLWGWARDRYAEPKRFFEHFFVANYCPLVFMEGETGRNRVPEKLKKAEREPLFAACDQALRDTVSQMKPRIVLGVGKWPMTRAQKALDGVDVVFGSILHPSPANPHANKGWGEKAEAQLQEILGAGHPALTFTG